MKNKKLNNTPFWPLAFRLAVLFIIIVVIIQFIWEWVATGSLNFISENIKNGNWISYVVSRLFFGAVYGLVSAYFLKRNAAKK